jgi:hypothetical protein
MPDPAALTLALVRWIGPPELLARLDQLEAGQLDEDEARRVANDVQLMSRLLIR